MSKKLPARWSPPGRTRRPDRETPLSVAGLRLEQAPRGRRSVLGEPGPQPAAGCRHHRGDDGHHEQRKRAGPGDRELAEAVDQEAVPQRPALGGSGERAGRTGQASDGDGGPAEQRQPERGVVAGVERGAEQRRRRPGEEPERAADAAGHRRRTAALAASGEPVVTGSGAEHAAILTAPAVWVGDPDGSLTPP